MVDILATEDDVVIDFIFGMLEENRFVCFSLYPIPRKALRVTDLPSNSRIPKRYN